ncbi:MAG: hypothetical protein AAF800_12055 [Planctomycetota bacterium]
MKPTPIACYALTASALVLSGMLLVTLAQRTGPAEADAAMVIARQNFTLMTAATRSGEESLFVLDNTTGTLLVYRLDISREQLVPGGGIRLDEVFSGGNAGGNDNRRR